MKKNFITRQNMTALKLILVILVSSILPVHAQIKETFDLKSVADSIYEKEQQFHSLIEKGDTVQAINQLLELGSIHAHRAQFAYAYEHLWNALSLSTSAGDSVSLYKIYEQLGWLYSYYNRPEKALEYYLKSNGILNDLIRAKVMRPKFILSGYYGLAILYRDQRNLEMYKNYLDSCLITLDKYNVEEDRQFINAELAYYALLSAKDYSKTIQLLKDAEPWFQENQVSYLIILYSFLGDAYYMANNLKESELYYNKALAYADKYTRHLNHVPKIYESMSKMYFDNGNLGKAYSSLQMAKKVDDLLFDSRSVNNRAMLEISDKFKQEQELRLKLVQEQKIAELEHKKKVSYYRNLILIVVLISIIIVSLLGRRAIRIKHRNEKELNAKKHELEQKHNQELLDNKNKELASTALQLAEKDKLLDDLKKRFLDSNELPKKSEITRIFKNITINSNQNWKAFEARFIETNDDFYSELIKLYPELTPGELKLCALLKLNFSSKEIASLLGVGNDSVNTLRHRLRKKIGLSRSDNITKFLNTIS